MRKEYRTFTKHSPLHFDTIHREITYDNNGNIVDVQDRNLSEEFRKEIRSQDKAQKEIQRKKQIKNSKEIWKNMSKADKQLVYFGYTCLFIAFLIVIFLFIYDSCVPG
ncbi:MAG: hypothetical protein Q4A17_05790 [Thermoguttaceae bacterium]|nr:hypothetical protein [Thermoguttaceae bacterium]